MFPDYSQLRTKLGRIKLIFLSNLWVLRHQRRISDYFRQFNLESIKPYKLTTWHFGNRYFRADYVGPQGRKRAFIKTTPLSPLIAREVRAIEQLHMTSKSTVNHFPDIIAFDYADAPYPFVALEFLNAQQLEPNAPYTESEKASLIAQLATILEALHMNKLIHRDILPRNFLVEKVSGSLRLILIDFAFTLNLDTPLKDFANYQDEPSLVKGLGKKLKPGPFTWDDAYSICKVMTLIDENCTEKFSEPWQRAQNLVGKLTYTAKASNTEAFSDFQRVNRSDISIASGATKHD